MDKGSNMTRLVAMTFALLFALGLLAPVAARESDARHTTQVNLYLVDIGGGTANNTIGCGDALTAGTTRIAGGGSEEQQIKRTLEQLLAIKSQWVGESGLYDALYQSDLHVQRVLLNHGSAKVYLTGQMQLGGECDDPRVEAQLSQTVLQF